jgi:VanZ family protein
MGIIKNRKYLAINLILFAILYFSVSFNKEYIRPVYGHSPIIGIITGSFSNFMAAYIVSLFSVAAILAKKIEIKKAKLIFYVISILVFIILTIEELKPFVSASKTYDIYDILASGLGSFLAILTFEVFIKKIIKKRN